MKYLFLLLFSCALFGEDISLLDKLKEAQTGGYLVTVQNKQVTLLHIFEKSEGTLILEEVSIPLDRFRQYQGSSRAWFESGAPGHTSWLMTHVNLTTGKCEECYSCTHQGWVSLSEEDAFLTTLFTLRFQKVDDAHRRRVGPPPGYNRVDNRPIWNPPLVIEGALHENAPFSAWKALWPSDGTELAQKTIEVYLPDSLGHYPTYFPYWVEIEGKIGSARVRVIDSGPMAHSTQNH